MTRSVLHSTFYIMNWIFWSNITIIFNKWLLGSYGFHYPIILTTWHLIFAAIATQILARTTIMLDSRKDIRMTVQIYLRTIAPIGLLYSTSTVCSNIACLYLNVPFAQMVKAAGPVAALLTTWAWGVTKPSMPVLINILIIAFSVGITVFGEIQFSWIGLTLQFTSLISDANRLVMIQILLSDDGQKMDPLVTLYYFAPVCAVMSFLISAFTEIGSFHWDDITIASFTILIFNAIISFILTISIVFLIRETSSVTIALISIPKNILLIILSIMFWGTPISFLQIIGYFFALLGLLYYSIGSEFKDLRKTVITWGMISRYRPIWRKVNYGFGGNHDVPATANV